MDELKYNFLNIAKIVKGKIISNPLQIDINEIFIDSRNVGNISSSLFIAIDGKNHNGHNYINDLFEKGIKNFIISNESFDISKYTDANFILVNNSINALQLLATFKRKQFTYPIVGITGSNGKTIVKEWLFQLLNQEKKVVRSPKSFNSQVGVPLSIWQMSADNDFGIFEAGISEPDEMDNLQHIINPTIGIFTNIGQAHDENFIHFHQKIGEKLKLFTKVEVLIYCTDYYDIRERVITTEILKNIKLFTWARKGNADVIVKSIQKNNKCSTIILEWDKNSDDFTIPFTDEASIENAMHCWMLMKYIGYDSKVIRERMLGLQSVAMRLELKEGINNCSVINDSYNSDLNSLGIAIDFLNQQKQHPNRTLILSDILQSGKGEDDLYEEVASLIANKGITKLIGIGKAISRQKNKFNIEKYFYSSTNDFIDEFSSSMFFNETILLKGARIFEFEQISNLIQQKAHETVLEINLNAIVHNLNFYKSLIKPTTKIMAMVKAFSYGSGSYEIANILQYQRVDYLSVAYADEGAELRKAGITVPIMVMNPDEQSFDTILQYNLEPEIYSHRIFDLLINTINRKHKKIDKTVLIHLKLDTGMHRLGFEEIDLLDICNKINCHKEIIKVQSVFTHLASADDKNDDVFTKHQISLFEKMSGIILDELQYTFMRHALNSAGIVRFPGAHFDMVRLGIGLYGVSSEVQNELMNVSTLKTIISQIKILQSSETIGYNRKGLLNKESKIATINIGYADGLNRKLGNGVGKVLVNGQLAPFIGSICMDMCMIDITGINAEEGDDVIIFGKEIPVSTIAEQIGTIHYEVFTSLSRRIKRIYYSE
ncbi:MAG: bifunctional UDP-N-acetylmuramoyl-tripeptide:D-alanyl-D-alanine ligase/alanine racemase [Bacteroidota bacterium]